MEDRSGGYIIPPKVQLSLYEQYPSLKWNYDVSLLRSAVAEAEGDIVWQRAFDNVLEGVDEMIAKALIDALEYATDIDYMDDDQCDILLNFDRVYDKERYRLHKNDELQLRALF